jgi:hypothetical protein
VALLTHLLLLFGSGSAVLPSFFTSSVSAYFNFSSLFLFFVFHFSLILVFL